MVKIKNVTHAKEVYGGLTLLVGMRMHSNIIAATQGVPFVAVAYEYKTQGIASDLGLEDYSLVCEKVTGDTLYAQVHLMLERIDEVKKLMSSRLAMIQEKEIRLWMERLEK
jgi:colanic acid/amylovoran biosynthesis protein